MLLRDEKKKKNRGSIKKEDEIIGFAEQGVLVAMTILNYLIYSLCLGKASNSFGGVRYEVNVRRRARSHI